MNPHLIVITRESALQRVGAWSSSIFFYTKPKIGFARGEQRLLSEALRGLTDEELCKELDVSLSAVKKGWRSIYSRVERSGLGILPSLSDERGHNPDRGKGKKHRLLAYIREHPEELRPVSIKLLGQREQQRGDQKIAQHTIPLRRRVGRPRPRPS